MGLVIPWRNVRQGHVPTVGDFEAVAEEVLRISAAHPRIIKGAAFVGSLPRGDINPRSDLDLIAVGYDASFDRAHDLVRGFEVSATDRGIALDCRLWRSSDARLGRHGYGPSYLETLPQDPTEYSVGHPLADCFRVVPGSVQAEMFRKIEHKLRSTRTRAWHFNRSRFGNPDRIEQWLCDSWERVIRPMRVHVTLGRRMLWWKHGVLPRDGKVDVVEQFLQEPDFAPFAESYRRLVAIDGQYDHLLVRARNGSSRRGRYLNRAASLLRMNFEVSLDLLSSVTAFMRADTLQRRAA